MEPESRPIWTDAEDTCRPRVASRWGRPIRPDSNEYRSNHVTLWRWWEDFQHDFAARMDWTVQRYQAANHPPVPVLAHPDTGTVRSGEIFGLNAAGTYDRDGDSMSRRAAREVDERTNQDERVCAARCWATGRDPRKALE